MFFTDYTSYHRHCKGQFLPHPSNIFYGQYDLCYKQIFVFVPNGSKPFRQRRWLGSGTQTRCLTNAAESATALCGTILVISFNFKRIGHKPFKFHKVFNLSAGNHLCGNIADGGCLGRAGADGLSANLCGEPVKIVGV